MYGRKNSLLLNMTLEWEWHFYVASRLPVADEVGKIHRSRPSPTIINLLRISLKIRAIKLNAPKFVTFRDFLLDFIKSRRPNSYSPNLLNPDPTEITYYTTFVHWLNSTANCSSLVWNIAWNRKYTQLVTSNKRKHLFWQQRLQIYISVWTFQAWN